MDLVLYRNVVELLNILNNPNNTGNHVLLYSMFYFLPGYVKLHSTQIFSAALYYGFVMVMGQQQGADKQMDEQMSRQADKQISKWMSKEETA